METNRPRIPAGATSEIYIGDRFEASPIAVPPRIRQKTKQHEVRRQGVPDRRHHEDHGGDGQAAICVRSGRSKPPAPIAPIRQPTSASYWPSPRGNCPTSSRMLDGSRRTARRTASPRRSPPSRSRRAIRPGPPRAKWSRYSRGCMGLDARFHAGRRRREHDGTPKIGRKREPNGGN